MKLSAPSFGHDITWDTDELEWRWNDTGEIVTPEGCAARQCPKCGEKPTARGHDPCIENLPGVEFACCGHGRSDGYIAFTNGTVIRGVFAVDPEREA